MRCPAPSSRAIFTREAERVDRGTERRLLERLVQKGEALFGLEPAADFALAVARCDDDRQARADLPQLRDELLARTVREAHVDHREYEPRAVGAGLLERRPRGPDLDDVEAELFQRIGGDHRDECLVLDQQHFRFVDRASIRR